jgi:hypothetical protein
LLKIKKYIFIIVCIIFLIFFILTCTPAVSQTILEYPSYNLNTNTAGYKISESNNVNNGNLDFKLVNPIIPEIGDYFLIGLKAKNTGGVEYPYSSVLTSWMHKSEDPGNKSQNEPENAPATINEQNFNILIDGFEHSYFIPVGENKSWTMLDKIRKGLSDKSNSYITMISIKVPEIEGINTQIQIIELKRRTIFPVDSYLNYFFKKIFNLQHINRFLTPAYIFILLIILLFIIHRLIFYKKKYVQLVPSTPSLKIIFISFLGILIIFSFYFISSSFFTVKSYRDSYKKYIISGELDKTYLGFYNFEKFIYWADTKIPEDENIVVLLRGDPVYIMSELAYNLYPRDIKYINISQGNIDKILEEIKKINYEYSNNYKYIIILSEKDIPASNQLEFIDKYRENGGFVYKLR